MRLVAIGNDWQRYPKRDLLGNEIKATGRIKTALVPRSWNTEVNE